jgi:DNA primase
MNTLVEDLDLDDPKAKSEIAAQVLPLIKDVPDPVERDGYLQRLSRLLKIDERTLMTARPAASPSRRRRYVNKTTFAVPQDGESTLVAAGPSNLTVELERHVLRLLLRQPDMLYILDRSLQRSELKRFAPEDFEQSDHQILARLIIRGLEQDEMDTHQYIGDHLPAAIEEQAQELLLPVIPDDPGNRRYLEDLVRSVLRLRQVRIGEGINQLRYLQEDMQNQGEVHLEIYHETVVQYTQVLSRINQALGKQFKPD